jgi:hypothetical protein
MKRFFPAILIATIAVSPGFARRPPLEKTALPKNIVPLDIASDIFYGRFFILDESGKVVAIDSTGEVVASLDPVSSAAGIIEIVDIAFSAGWIYIADNGGGAIYITDRTLREPSKIALDFDGESIRPSKIAIATDGRILILDSDKDELLLLDDWKDVSPLSLFLPEDARAEAIRAIQFDRILNEFVVLTESHALIYSLFGALESRYILPENGFDQPVAAFVVNDFFTVIGKDSVAIFGDRELNILPLESSIITATQDIAGRAVMATKNRIIVRENFE